MEFRILGPLEVVDDGRPIELSRRLSRALLAYLLLHANEPVSSDRLIDELWGAGAPKTATASLQNYVSRLRKSLGSDVIQLEPAGYVLRVDPERLDLARFERLVQEAQGAPATQRAELLRAALSLWRGDPLEDLAFEEFAQEEIALLAERRLGAIEDRIDADLELGGGPELVDELEALLAAHRLRERLHGQLMLALYRGGRQADALAAYQEARRVLDEELGLEPGDELRALERKILEQDPSLRAAGVDRTTAESRRTVSVLFCDIVDSTRLATELDAEAYRRLLSLYFDAVRGAVEAHGGTVEKFIGDAVMGLFGVPDRHEDDALRAVRAAVDARVAVAQMNEEAKRNWDVEAAIRIAVNTGEVIVPGSGEPSLVLGPALNVAAHLEERASANEILLGDETQRLVRDAVRVERVELGDGLSGWRLDEVVAGAPAVERRLDAPLVGRKKELRRLRTAFQRARKDRCCSIVSILGEAGIGKTRLAREFVESAKDEARVLVGRCVSYGAGATYLPIAEIVKQAAPEASVAGIASLLAGEEDAEQVAQRVAEIVGWAEGPAAPGEAFWAIRRLLEAIAREQPLIVALDDIHWAEPTLLDLVEYLGEWVDAPVLVLCLSRRDLLESRPGWGGPTSTGFVIELDPLAAEDVTALVEKLAAGPVAPDIQERIVEHAGGNPLFAEQLLALAAEAPDVSLEHAPPTVEALIASRLDRLDPRELDILRRASVVGRHFTRTDVKDLGAFHDADLAALQRRALVHPTTDGRLRFHHALIRDVAYRGIPKAERAELHERAADSLDRRDAADELVGYHLEQAYSYRAELARVDHRARRLANAAGDRLGRAGIRAWKRADAPAATNLLSRATSLLPTTDSTRRGLLCELAVAMRAAGQSDRANQVLESAIQESVDERDRRVELRARIELAHNRSHHRTPQDSTAVTELLDVARAAIPLLEEMGDDRSLGRAWIVIGFTEGAFHLQFATQEEAAERAAYHYRQGGWSPSACLGVLMTALYYGPRPVGQAIARCEQLLEEHPGDRASEANALQWLGGLEAMQGRFDDARAHIVRARTLYEELGLQLAVGDACAMVLADVELLASRMEIAEQNLRQACDTCLRLNESSLLASRAAQLADALYELGQYEEAEAWAHLSQERADVEDLHAQASWRCIESRLTARRGGTALALQLIDEARDILEQGDGLNQRAKLQLDLADVCRLAKRDRDARRAVERAIELYKEKGNETAALNAHAFLDALAVV